MDDGIEPRPSAHTNFQSIRYSLRFNRDSFTDLTIFDKKSTRSFISKKLQWSIFGTQNAYNQTVNIPMLAFKPYETVVITSGVRFWHEKFVNIDFRADPAGI